jgi:hypothetical protein
LVFNEFVDTVTGIVFAQEIAAQKINLLRRNAAPQIKFFAQKCRAAI